jgi:hypothetical protein
MINMNKTSKKEKPKKDKRPMLSCIQHLDPIISDLIKKDLEEEKIQNEMAKHIVNVEYKKYHETLEKRKKQEKKQNKKYLIRDSFLGLGSGLITAGLVTTASILLGVIPPIGIVILTACGFALIFSGLAAVIGKITRHFKQQPYSFYFKKKSPVVSEQELDSEKSTGSSIEFSSSQSLIMKMIPQYPTDSTEDLMSDDYFPEGRICGNKITSRMEGESVNNMTNRSIPIPSPAVGGNPYSNAVI